MCLGRYPRKLPSTTTTTGTGKKNPPLQCSPPCSPCSPFPLLAFHSSWLIMSSSLSPRDATCLSIGQHSLYEVTWEPSHPALRPLWGSFERGKKERPKSSLDGGWTNRYKATLELNVLSLCVWTRARQSRQRVGSHGGVGTGWKGLSVPACHPFLCPSRKSYYTETSKNQVYFEPVKITLPELSFWTLLASSEIPCMKTSHFQSYFVTKRLNQQLLSI